MGLFDAIFNFFGSVAKKVNEAIATFERKTGIDIPFAGTDLSKEKETKKSESKPKPKPVQVDVKPAENVAKTIEKVEKAVKTEKPKIKIIHVENRYTPPTHTTITYVPSSPKKVEFEPKEEEIHIIPSSSYSSISISSTRSTRRRTHKTLISHTSHATHATGPVITTTEEVKKEIRKKIYSLTYGLDVFTQMEATRHLSDFLKPKEQELEAERLNIAYKLGKIDKKTYEEAIEKLHEAARKELMLKTITLTAPFAVFAPETLGTTILSEVAGTAAYIQTLRKTKNPTLATIVDVGASLVAGLGFAKHLDLLSESFETPELRINRLKAKVLEAKINRRSVTKIKGELDTTIGKGKLRGIILSEEGEPLKVPFKTEYKYVPKKQLELYELKIGNKKIRVVRALKGIVKESPTREIEPKAFVKVEVEDIHPFRGIIRQTYKTTEYSETTYIPLRKNYIQFETKGWSGIAKRINRNVYKIEAIDPRSTQKLEEIADVLEDITHIKLPKLPTRISIKYPKFVRFPLIFPKPIHFNTIFDKITKKEIIKDVLYKNNIEKIKEKFEPILDVLPQEVPILKPFHAILPIVKPKTTPYQIVQEDTIPQQLSKTIQIYDETPKIKFYIRSPPYKFVLLKLKKPKKVKLKLPKKHAKKKKSSKIIIYKFFATPSLVRLLYLGGKMKKKTKYTSLEVR